MVRTDTSSVPNSLRTISFRSCTSSSRSVKLRYSGCASLMVTQFAPTGPMSVTTRDTGRVRQRLCDIGRPGLGHGGPLIPRSVARQTVNHRTDDRAGGHRASQFRLSRPIESVIVAPVKKEEHTAGYSALTVGFRYLRNFGPPPPTP